MIPVGFGSSAGGIDTGDIANSLRLRSAASASLSKSFTPDRQTFTISLWCKKSAMNAFMSLVGFSNTYTLAQWGTSGSGSDILQFYGDNNAMSYVMSGVHRDPTSWMHIVMVANTTHATSTERFKVYINGTQVTAWSTSTAPAQNANLIPSGATIYFGQRGGSPTGYFDGYLSRVCFVDGQALTPSSFGYLNTEINEWVSKKQSEVKAVVDAGGANSFMLDFDDATSLTTLGYDKSSKGNNWTCNNISLTAGVTYDHMTDVSGNSFATLNNLLPLLNAPTVSEGGLKFTGPAGQSWIKATIPIPTSGKWYWEVQPATTSSGTEAMACGIATDAAAIGTAPYGLSGTYWYYSNNGNKSVNGGASSTYGTGYSATTDVIGFLFDADAGTITAYLNNSSQGTLASSLSGVFWPAVADTGSTYANSWYLNFGQRPFAYTPPTGFLALCQANLPDPAILNPKEHFDVNAYLGNGATSRSFSSFQFDPDFIWHKNRTTAYYHRLVDRLRGVRKTLYSNQTAAETDEWATYGEVNSFDTGGYTITTGGTAGNFIENLNNEAQVAWLWKAGGAGVTNTAGSITSTVSANVEAGFSIVAATTPVSNTVSTIGHGLSAPPSLIIAKTRGVSASWYVYHKDVGNTKILTLNGTGAASSADSKYWNNTSPTSSVFTIMNGSTAWWDLNATHIFYCFAEIPGYSKFGSYVGNGSADGPFVFCGFRPRYVLIKEASGTNAASAVWVVFDTARDTDNQTDNRLFPNLPDAEVTTNTIGIDITAMGFKPRVTNFNVNETNGTYLFAAFADVTGRYSLAR